ncbi:hypothetical protein [Caviibacter abscessus]|uniref:hypothetical protein n=1 Tax=Caviibacter abscessus TaxID=1766719 RepID=UPI000830754A|nr:hypothetical protein [Caviibacter abscessus]
MAHDFKNLKDGKYYYNQSTIWSKVINIEPINPYWEIYNNIDSYLFKNLEYENLKEMYFNFFDFLLKKLELNKNDFIFISSDNVFIKILEEYEVKNINEIINFKFNDVVVGTYSKLYYCKNGKYILLLDFAHFNIDENNYNEISINNYYLEMFDYISSNIKPKKIRFYETIYNDEIKYENLNDLDLYRYISFMDTINFLKKYNIKISSSYKGHTLKIILKQLLIYSYISGKDINLFLNLLPENYKSYIFNEIDNIENNLFKYIDKYDFKTLKETYGFNQNIILLKKGNYKKSILNIQKII